MGEAEDVFDRLDEHKRCLKNGKHHCKALQYDWNASTDNEKEFSFLPVHIDEYLYLNRKDRKKLEVKYIQHLTSVDTNFAYNIQRNRSEKYLNSNSVLRRKWRYLKNQRQKL